MNLHDATELAYKNGYEAGKPKWIPVTERLPEEHESIFAKVYRTERWEPLMFLNVSDDVLVVVKYENGETKVKTTHTTDGEWRLISIYGAKEVTHWMPLPSPPSTEVSK